MIALSVGILLLVPSLCLSPTATGAEKSKDVTSLLERFAVVETRQIGDSSRLDKIEQRLDYIANQQATQINAACGVMVTMILGMGAALWATRKQ
jgi:hypothetical protein